METATSAKQFVLVHVAENMTSLKDLLDNFGPQVVQFGIPWRLHYRRHGDFLSLYLQCDRAAATSPEKEWSIDVGCELKLISSDGKVVQRNYELQFKGVTGFGNNHFYPWDDMIRQFSSGDRVILEAHVTIEKMEGIEKREKLKVFDDDVAKGFSDVTLIVQEEKFYVSKWILAHQSSFFKTLLLGSFQESLQDEITLNDINPEDFQRFLELIHLKPSLTDDCVEAVLQIADMYDAEDVTRLCQEFLIQNSKLSLRKKLHLSTRYKLEELKETCFSAMTSSTHVRSAMETNMDDLEVMKALLEKSLSFK